MSVAAYKRTIRESETPRQIEARLFARITGEMDRHRADFEAAATGEDRLQVLSSGLRQALSDNRKLWATLRGDLASPSNALAPDLRAQLLSLSIFVEKTTLRIMGGAPGLGGLIEMNRAILTGLTRQAGASTGASTAQGGGHGAQPYAQTL